MLNDVLDDRGAKPLHTVGMPPGHAPAVQRQIGCSRPFHIRDCIENGPRAKAARSPLSGAALVAGRRGQYLALLLSFTDPAAM